MFQFRRHSAEMFLASFVISKVINIEPHLAEYQGSVFFDKMPECLLHAYFLNSHMLVHPWQLLFNKHAFLLFLFSVPRWWGWSFLASYLKGTISASGKIIQLIYLNFCCKRLEASWLLDHNTLSWLVYSFSYLFME